MSSKSKNVFDAVNHLLSIPEKLMFHPWSNDLENKSNNIPVDILDAPKEYMSTWMYLACRSLRSCVGKRKREPQKLVRKFRLHDNANEPSGITAKWGFGCGS
ncbi:hypothetical protein OIU76_018280 [Salix suchowensis]|nr:hypothetical protein OIU76_018280 [Salix suchowensis]KAJ6342365.1 hypothetical protein OIU78_010319 [Salix suchowensis]